MKKLCLSLLFILFCAINTGLVAQPASEYVAKCLGFPLTFVMADINGVAVTADDTGRRFVIRPSAYEVYAETEFNSGLFERKIFNEQKTRLIPAPDRMEWVMIEQETEEGYLELLFKNIE